MRSYIIAGILAIILFVAGINVYGLFIELILPRTPGVKYTVIEFSDTFIKALIFSLTLAFVPVATVVVYKAGAISAPGKKILTVIFILGGMILLLTVRYFMLLAQEHPPEIYPPVSIPFRNTYLEECMLAGLLVGAITAWLVLRQKRRETARK